VIDLSAIVTQKQFGELVGISQPAVSDLLMRGVISDGSTAGDWLLDYCRNLREVAAGRAAAGDLDLAGERAALARAQRERIEMQNAVTRGELAPVSLIEEVLTKAASKTAGILDAIPGMIRRRVPLLTADDIELVAGEVAKARNMVAAMSLADLNDDIDGPAVPPAPTFGDSD
jgi:phage terminase Nu1 subunit (DNA packaging protein)